MTRRRSPNWFQKSLKDYIVPIIGGILVLFLIFSIFSWDDTDSKTNIENQSWITLSLDTTSSEATIIYSWDYKKEIEWDSFLYKWEKVLVKQWSISLKLDNLVNFKINRLWELKYLENGWFSVSSWEVWIDSLKPLNLDLSFAKLKIDENSHLSVSQNEMWSTIYLISWFLEVENLVWKNTVLAPWEKITISRADASKDSVDLTLLKENIDQFFIKSDWYILNKWSSYILSDVEDIEDENSKTQSWSLSETSSWEILNFTNLVDESNVSSPLINISGTYSDLEISSITVNWKDAILSKTNKTFKFENIDVSNKENDLVFKVYDESNDIIYRDVYTVYYKLGSDDDSSETIIKTTETSSTWPKVHNFTVDWSQFLFTSPTTQSTYTTTDNFITIRWSVKAEWIDSITINDFKLSSFNGSTWRYHADVEFNNLAEWTNVYEIKYFSWDKLAYTNYFTIIKKSSWNSNISSPEVEDTQIEEKTN